MIQIGDAIVSLDVIERKFCCDLIACKGACCVEGDAGAPLEEGEVERIRENYERFRPYMKPEGIAAVEEQGFSVIDVEGDEGTPLINGKECAYSINEDGGCWCAIEKAWSRGESSFRKPISCHLYPIRITRYRHHEAVNFNEWKVCFPAMVRGEREGVPVYVFCRDALVAKYGEEWYEQLCYAAEQVRSGKIRFR